jgi:hypothetical protein
MSREIASYSPLVQVGDLSHRRGHHVNGQPTRPDFGAGPIKRFMDMSYTDAENRLGDQLNIVTNDWDAVVAHLKAHHTF